jgi:hypothetical protein
MEIHMNSEDNIVKMPSVLARQAKRIQRCLARDIKIRAEWIENKLEMADALTTARAQFKDHAEFGKWLNANGFGENVLSHQDRAALIQFGSDLRLARSILEKAESWSVRVIHQNEWPPPFTNVGKTLRGRKPKPAPKTESVQDIVETLVREGRPVNRAIVGREFNVGQHAVQLATARAKGKLEAEPLIDPASLSLTAQQKAGLSLKQQRKALEREFDERVRLKVLEENKDFLAQLEQIQQEASEKWKLYHDLVNEHKPVFTEPEFMLILTCLHPDNSASKEKREQAFSAFNAMRLQLTGKK